MSIADVFQFLIGQQLFPSSSHKDIDSWIMSEAALQKIQKDVSHLTRHVFCCSWILTWRWLCACDRSVLSWSRNWQSTRTPNPSHSLAKRKYLPCVLSLTVIVWLNANSCGVSWSALCCLLLAHRLVTFITSQPEPLSAAKGAPPNPWHSSGGGGGGCIIC